MFVGKRLGIGVFVLGVLAAASCGDDDGTGGPGPSGPGGTGGGTGGEGGTGAQGGGGGVPAGRDGTPCASDADCDSGLCFTETADGWPSGYCAGLCDPNAGDCPGGGECIEVGFGTGYCLDTCASTAECRDAYACEDPGVGETICLPACTTDAQCPTVGTCDANLGLCIAPETNCDDFADNDQDDLVDCEDPTDCQTTPTCQPGTTPTGQACDASSDCVASNNDPLCLSEETFGWPMGTCSEFCDVAANDCGSGDAVCVPTSLPSGTGICADACATSADCRLGYACDAWDPMNPGTLVCLPRCTDDAHCTGFCNDDNQLCSAMAEDCTNGTDDDGDGLFDCEGDADCQADCAAQITNACAMAPAALASNPGDTMNGTNLFAGSCTGGGGAREVVYVVTPGTVGQQGTLTLTLQSDTDQGIYVRTACADADSEIGCVDAALGGTDETLSIGVQGGVPVTVFVDGYTSTESGPYVLGVSFEAAVCGDGNLTAPEECDDNNVLPGDGCDPTCHIEYTFFCATAQPILMSNMGTTEGGTTVFEGSCTGGNAASERIFTYVPLANGTLSLVLSSATDQGIYVRADCADAATEIGCVDNLGGGNDETLDVPVTAGVPVSIFVDGYYDPMDAGPFTLTYTFTP